MHGSKVGIWALTIGAVAVAVFQTAGAPADNLPLIARQHIATLQAEKASRTPSERKLDSQLIYTLRQQRNGQVAAGLSRFKSDLRLRPGNRVQVDIQAEVSAPLLQRISALGATMVFSSKSHHSIRAELPLAALVALASDPLVQSIRPADEALAQAVSPVEGDIAHGADLTRARLSVNGSGIKIGVLSDSVRYLANLQSSGLMPPVTVLPGQEGIGTIDAGEGTAMLQIVHQLAPGASLYFATAFSGIPSFAQNIRDLRAAGCNIIVDDVIYFRESPLQDGPIAQAVQDVCADGALFFSSGGNGGNLDDGTSTTWRGDFVDGGAASIAGGGRLHDFGGSTFNTVLPNAISSLMRADLFWSDPLGSSTNDYDLYVIDSTGAVVRSSTNIQDGHGDPYEEVPIVQIGERLVIVKASGADRFLHLATYGGRLAFSSNGSIRGHNATIAENAFCVAASRVPSPSALFTGGSSNPVEYFSSDGPRRIFFTPDGTPITPGNFSSTGGAEHAKPDITAADGVNTAVPGFGPFLGTSAAAPHAAAIAGLLWSHDPSFTPAELRQALSVSALDIEAPGADRDSGAGIVMASQAIDALPMAAPNLTVQAVQMSDANGNGNLELSECADVSIVLKNVVGPSGQTATGIVAVLTSTAPEIRIDPAPQFYPDIPGQGSSTNLVPFRISTTSAFVCGRNVTCELLVSTADGNVFHLPLTLVSQIGNADPALELVSTNAPISIPDLDTVESTVDVQGVSQQIADVVVSVHVTHHYDSDLTLALVGPDGTRVVLTENNGGSGTNYGSDCSSPTVFADAAANGIAQGTAPFIGMFKPQEPLTAFRGKSGSGANGVWRLQASDRAEQDSGTLECWSLQLTTYTCADGGGACLVPPAIVQQPQDVTVTNGSTVSLHVTVEGTSPIGFQWIQNGTNIVSDAIGPDLVITNIQASQAGSYSVLVTNAYGFALSASAEVTVLVPAMIVAGPADVRAVRGSTIQLTVLAEGTEPVSYEWHFASASEFAGASSPPPLWWLNPDYLIPNATNATLALTNITSALAGEYVVTVSNAYNTTSSPPASLTVLELPVITAEPVDVVVTNGSAAGFSAAATGTEPLTYQWFFNGSNVVAGATSATLDLVGVTPSQAGLYSVFVTNEAGGAWSREALLTVLTVPSIVQQPASQVTTNRENALFAVLANGTAPLEYQWFFNATNLLVNATNSDLLLSNVTAAAAGTYTVSVSNLLGGLTSEPATLTVLEPPSIASEPSDFVATNGASASFTVAATGTEPLTYQWFFNQTNQLGATGTNLDLTALTPAQAGHYSVVVSNQVGTLRSREALLTVLTAPIIVQDPLDQVATNGDTVTLHRVGRRQCASGISMVSSMKPTCWQAPPTLILFSAT